MTYSPNPNFVYPDRKLPLSRHAPYRQTLCIIARETDQSHFMRKALSLQKKGLC